MFLYIFTRDGFPESRQAKEVGEKLQKEGYEVKFFDADDPSASQLQEIYDLYSYPTFVVVEDNGAEIECWRGIIPLESDLKQFLLA